MSHHHHQSQQLQLLLIFVLQVIGQSPSNNILFIVFCIRSLYNSFRVWHYSGQQISDWSVSSDTEELWEVCKIGANACSGLVLYDPLLVCVKQGCSGAMIACSASMTRASLNSASKMQLLESVLYIAHGHASVLRQGFIYCRTGNFHL